jgi:hypothetical protein
MVQTEEARAGAVSPERFAAAKTYEQYLASITQNLHKFQENYAQTHVPEEYTMRLRRSVARPGGPARLLVIAEDWCTDVYRGLPVLQRVAEAAGIDLRVIERDQNLDVAEHFKKDGQFLSVPTVICFTRDFRYLDHWIERPAAVTAELGTTMRPLIAPYVPQGLAPRLGREPTEEEKAEAGREMRRVMDEFQATDPAWGR